MSVARCVGVLRWLVPAARPRRGAVNRGHAAPALARARIGSDQASPVESDLGRRRSRAVINRSNRCRRREQPAPDSGPAGCGATGRGTTLLKRHKVDSCAHLYLIRRQKDHAGRPVVMRRPPPVSSSVPSAVNPNVSIRSGTPSRLLSVRTTRAVPCARGVAVRRKSHSLASSSKPPSNLTPMSCPGPGVDTGEDALGAKELVDEVCVRRDEDVLKLTGVEDGKRLAAETEPVTRNVNRKQAAARVKDGEGEIPRDASYHDGPGGRRSTGQRQRGSGRHRTRPGGTGLGTSESAQRSQDERHQRCG